MPSEGKKVQITYSTSVITAQSDQKDTIRRLGFTRLGQTIEQPDTPAIRGMIHKVRHLVTVKEVDG
jgi:large subunit ribosomal protein L30